MENRSYRHNNTTYLLGIEYRFNCIYVRIKAILGCNIHCYQYMAYDTYSILDENTLRNQCDGFDTIVEYPKTLTFCVDTDDFVDMQSLLAWLFSQVRPYVATIPLEDLRVKEKGMNNYWEFVSNAIMNA